MTSSRQARLCTAFAAALLALAQPGFGDEGLKFRLLTPFPGAVVHGSQVLLVFAASPGQKVIVKVNDQTVTSKDPLAPGDAEDIHHVRLALTEGRQKIRVVNEASEAELGALSVTYIPRSSLRTAAAPGDKRYAFHTRENEEHCNGCHSLPGDVETPAGQALGPSGKVCGSCHPSVEGGKQLHAPVAAFECFKCHDSSYKPSRFGQKSSQAATCSTCHQDFVARALGSKYVHGPVAAGVCVVCHDPHGGSSKELLAEDGQELCMGCHADTLPLPTQRGLHGKLACSRCHNPHGAVGKHLTGDEGNRLCLGCHPRIAAGQTGHPLPGHPVEAPVDPSKPGKSMSCRSCHDPHGLKDISKAKLQENDPAWRRFCSKCHY